MSLSVPDEVVSMAKNGDLKEGDFVEVVKNSLPHAWNIFTEAAQKLQGQEQGPGICEPDDMDDEKRGQLLRALSSNAIRGAVEKHFGVVFAFQNCHKTGAFRPEEVGGENFTRFTSIESQVLNQQPGFVDC